MNVAAMDPQGAPPLLRFNLAYWHVDVICLTMYITRRTRSCKAGVWLLLTSSGVSDTRYGYYWKTSEAEKNLLRTHTTAVSSRMLYRLAQTQKDGFKPAKYFSIDRVFRNEAIDRTHLAEFHQIEGGSLTLGGTLPAGNLLTSGSIVAGHHRKM